MPGSFLVSAPGKTILFGEHSVVHGKPAIAAAVSLRTYILVSDGNDEIVTLDFPDIEFKRSWKITDLPFDGNSGIPTSLDTTLIDKLVVHVEGIENTFQHVAALTFLYLYVNICNSSTPGRSYVARSMLPVGAGLGSSAALSVCLAAAFLCMSGKDHKEISLTAIRDWSFIGEKCIHGNPSGIDNTVATFGGAVTFKKPDIFTPLTSFPPLKLILTNTAVPRRTSELVSNVGQLVKRLPAISNPILDAMGKVADEAKKVLEQGGSTLAQHLAELARINHGLLVSIGVSHPSLEKIKLVGDELKVGETKLTGAGGGGCAVTIVTCNDEELENRIESFRSSLPEQFQVYETELGGPGVGYSEVTTNIGCADYAKLDSSTQFDGLGTWKYF